MNIRYLIGRFLFRHGFDILTREYVKQMQKEIEYGHKRGTFLAEQVRGELGGQ